MRRFLNIPWSVVFCLPLGFMAALSLHMAFMATVYYDEFLGMFPVFRGPCMASGTASTVSLFALICGLCGLLLLAGAFCGFARRRWTLTLMQSSMWAAYLAVFMYAYLVYKISGLILPSFMKIEGVEQTAVNVFFIRWHLIWPALVLLLLFLVLHTLAWKRAVIFDYTGVFDEAPAAGDHILENLRTHGRAPEYRKSFIYSLTLHFMVIIVIPWLLSMRGCVTPYLIQQGDGAPNQVMTAMVQPRVVKKVKKKKKFLVNPKSAIVFKFPDLDDVKTLKEVQQQTEQTYQVNVSQTFASVAALGAGGKGTRAGWPEGAKAGKTRFIRMEYNGADWDDGMDAVDRADINFLDKFAKYTGLKVADKMEAHPIGKLKSYAKGYAPPFVYMTGSGGISVGQNDTKIMRDYLYDGGMLFADCSSPQWDRSFRDFVRQLLPGEPLVVIADDDPIFQYPFPFPNGAPPLWHHGGMQALGVKAKGRWIVFYHPGDINDAWKTGHSGLAPDKAEAAFQMGTNIIYYAFTHYLELTRKYRK